MGVEYSNGLIDGMQSAVKKSFNKQILLVRRPSVHVSSFNVSLREGEIIAELDDGQPQEVVEIARSQYVNTGFYFGLNISFVQSPTNPKTHLVEHASISVFQEIGDLIPLFRAEWSQADVDTTTSHAQPHWHFSQSPSRIEKLFISKFSSSKIKEFGEELPQTTLSNVVDCGHFHFAMTSQWDERPVRSVKRAFSTDDFLPWFRGLLQYIGAQIDHVLDKAPGQATKVFGSKPSS